MNAYLNTPILYNQSPSKVDREKGIIHDVVVVQTGEAKGHGYQLDNAFIEKVVELGNQTGPGIKARFGHPNICSTALGTYLGRFKNFRKSDLPPLGGLRGVADLHLDSVSQKSPKGNLYEYVLDMAENNPDMFGASIAFKHGKFKSEFKEIEGKKVEQKFATIESLYATDFVDSPAATDGLFEIFHEDDFAYQVTSFLDENPQIFKLLDSKPEILNQFLDKYKSHKSMNFSDEIQKLKSWVTENFSSKEPKGFAELESLKANFQKQITELEAKFPGEDLATRNSKLETRNSDLESRISKLQTQNSELQTQNSELETQINQLKAKPSASSTGGDPQLNINPKEKDDTGKVLLSELPFHLRKKLKVTQST